MQTRAADDACCFSRTTLQADSWLATMKALQPGDACMKTKCEHRGSTCSNSTPATRGQTRAQYTHTCAADVLSHIHKGAHNNTTNRLAQDKPHDHKRTHLKQVARVGGERTAKAAIQLLFVCPILVCPSTSCPFLLLLSPAALLLNHCHPENHLHHHQHHQQHLHASGCSHQCHANSP